MPKKANLEDPKIPATWKFPTSLLRDLKKVAELENRSVNNCVENILKNYAKNKLIGVKHHHVG